MNLTFELHGLEELRAKYGQGADSIIKAVTRGVAEALREQLASTPPPVHYPIQWASAKQRAWYFANRKGLGPYTRQSDDWSQRLGASWTTENRGLDGVVGAKAVGEEAVSYAHWVQSAERQQPMHKATGWVTDEQAIERVERSGAVERIFTQALEGW